VELDPEPELQPNWMLLICHPAVLLENPDHTKAVTALPFAPEKELRGIVTVWVLPVRPLTPYQADV
jgi:hypothetical protein